MPAEAHAAGSVHAAGVVLAGGQSRRMGRDKALLVVDGRPMAAVVADALRGAGCSPVLAVGGDAVALADLGVPVVADGWPGEGPLGAIVTALAHTRAPTMVVACDLPWLSAEVIATVIAAAARPGVDVALATTQIDPAAAARDEPMCACWQPSAASVLAARFAAGERAVHAAFDSLRVCRVPVPATALRNVNVPGDLPTA